MSKFLNDKGLE